MNRRNQILAAVVVIQILAVGIVFLPRLAPANTQSATLFAGLKAADVISLAILDQSGKGVELVKQNGQWVLPAHGDYPANPDSINSLLEKIVGLQTDPLVTRTSASHKRLQVADDDYIRRIDFKLTDGSSHTLFIGSSPGGVSAHIRAGGQDAVYLARNLASYDVSADVIGWVDPVYFSVAQDKIISATIENAHGMWAFEKDAQGNWTMKGLSAAEKFNPDSLAPLLSTISSLRLTSPLGKEVKPEYGIDKPGAVVTLTTQGETSGNNLTSTLRIGAKDAKDGSYVVISSESPYYVRVPGSEVEDFVTKSRNGFLVLPPTPTPSPTIEVTPTVGITPALESTPALTATLVPTTTVRPTPP